MPQENNRETIIAMDEAGIRLKLDKCKVAKPETHRLGCHISAAGIKQVDESSSKYIKPTAKEPNRSKILYGSDKSNK